MGTIVITWDFSPRVRGKVTPTEPEGYHSRITPACAGKSEGRVPGDRAKRDHPRVCGEKLVRGLLQFAVQGSPPRVRGKVQNSATIQPENGITPACAGKSRLSCIFRLRTRDHPRVCGEKVAGQLGQDYHQGSPPRVRGKALLIGRTRMCTGITPACAGKSRGPVPCGGVSEDHPRVCGEKFTSVSARVTLMGSPPRVRGKVTDRFRLCYKYGITPACAGKSRRLSCSVSCV